MTRRIFSSVTRISDLAHRPFDIQPVDKKKWHTGDYVVGEALDVSGYHSVELPNGRMMEAMEGHLVVGALGARAATLEAVGSWRDIIGDKFEAMTPAGLFGQITSSSPFLPRLMTLRYCGHAVRDGHIQSMDSMRSTPPTDELTAPIVLITGTSMSSGKTLSGQVVVNLLSRAGYKVIGAKVTGAARYRDMLTYQDAGAEMVVDFVDVGLPSTVTDPEDFRHRLDDLIHIIAAQKPDVVVAEAGASPLEPYNGEVAMEVLADKVKFSLLCASDPYAVLGVARAFNRQPDIVAGGAANTSAAISLVKSLTGLTALNLFKRGHRRILRQTLIDKLGLQ